MKPKKLIKSAPHLPVKNLRATLDYYDNLGFYNEWVFGDEDGVFREMKCDCFLQRTLTLQMT